MKHNNALAALVVAAGLAAPVWGLAQQQQQQQQPSQQPSQTQGSTAGTKEGSAQILGASRTIRGEVTAIRPMQAPGGGTNLLADLRTGSGQVVSVDLGKSDQLNQNARPRLGQWLAASGTLVRVNNWFYLFPNRASDVARINAPAGAGAGEAAPAGAQLPADQSGPQR